MTILSQAEALTNGERQSHYGHPLDDFTRTAHIWTGVLLAKLKPGCAISPEDIALCMIGVKMAREAHMPKTDNRIDGCGYWNTLDMLHEERERRKNTLEATNAPNDDAHRVSV